MAAPSVNTRKLKDSVAEYLKKNKLDKACETLEQLVKAEPKDMTHRLKLGDTYRRLDAGDKAIANYQAAAKFFADEDLLIKAIAAIKLILEIDPQNEMAQRALGEMNNRRFAKPTLEGAGLKAAPRPPAPREAPADADDAPAPAPAARTAGSARTGLDLSPSDEDETLELEDGRSFLLPTGAAIEPATASLPRPKGPPPKLRGAFDLGAGAPDPIDLDLAEAEILEPELEEAEIDEPELEEPEIEELPSEAILEARPGPTPAARKHVAKSPSVPSSRPPPPPVDPDGEDEPLNLRPSTAPIRSAPSRPALAARPGRAVASSGPANPIADLLGSDTDEIELLSISSDRELPPLRPTKVQAAESSEDVDRAFGAIEKRVEAPARPPTPRVALFDDLPQAAFVELVNRLSYLRFSAPELIIREGDPGRSFFVIVEGKVRVFKSQQGGNEITLAHLSGGAFFGEMALLSGAPRTANVAAEEDTEVLEVTDAVLREVVRKYPQVAASLKKFYRQRLLNNVMAISPLFKDFDPVERKSIVDRFKMRQFAQGEVLIAEGTPSDGLYVVLHGGVSIEKRAANNQRVALARLKEGDLFGEMSLLTRNNATATVTAASNSIVLKLPRENFQELVLSHPQILELVSTLTEARKNATQAILQGQGPGVDGMAFV
ncbi:MAG: hypothetical protein NVSMB23_16220 [Myxococcales bacterium]